MGNILNPGPENSFTRIVKHKDTDIFVDKTDFIGIMISKIDAERRFFAITRPRRFGKTITAHMLSAFFSKGFEGYNIFDGLKISYNSNFRQYLNQYNVLYIDMNTIDGLFDGYIAKSQKVEGVNDLSDFLEYSVISELKLKPEFAKCLADHKIENTGLMESLIKIKNDLGTKFIFIMDEWDLIYREYRDNELLQKKFIKLLKNLFKSDGGQDCFHLGYLTGILPIKKYNSQSALNGFKEYNMLSPEPFEQYFGFTEEEVDQIVKSPGCSLSYQELKDWYEGYRLNGTDIFNPNSVVSAIADGKCKGFWSGTSSNEEVVRLINLNFKGIKSDIIKLLDGLKLPFRSDGFQNDMTSISNKNDVYCLLVCLGYLGCTTTDNSKKLAYVPNHEIRQFLLSLVSGQKWSQRMDAIKRSATLLSAITKKQDSKTVAMIIEEIHNSSAVSLLNYNTEESLTYCVMTGLQWATLDDYSSHREDQAGKGRTDLVYEPDNPEAPLIIIEFKYGRSAETALKQIKSREYYKRYRRQYRNIILVGINYNKSTKEHQCVIEKL